MGTKNTKEANLLSEITNLPPQDCQKVLSVLHIAIKQTIENGDVFKLLNLGQFQPKRTFTKRKWNVQHLIYNPPHYKITPEFFPVRKFKRFNIIEEMPDRFPYA